MFSELWMDAAGRGLLLGCVAATYTHVVLSWVLRGKVARED